MSHTVTQSMQGMQLRTWSERSDGLGSIRTRTRFSRDLGRMISTPSPSSFTDTILMTKDSPMRCTHTMWSRGLTSPTFALISTTSSSNVSPATFTHIFIHPSSHSAACSLTRPTAGSLSHSLTHSLSHPLPPAPTSLPFSLTESILVFFLGGQVHTVLSSYLLRQSAYQQCVWTGAMQLMYMNAGDEEKYERRKE